jgi:hypothetical protein
MTGLGRPIGRALSLLEDAVGLIRSAGLPAVAMYLIGTLPLAMSLLVMWVLFARMQASGADLAGMSLAVTVSLVWAKCWQNRFTGVLLAELGEEGDESFPQKLSAKYARRLRLLGTQSLGAAITTALLLFSVPLVLPLVWVYPFCQHLMILLDGRRTFREAWSQAWARSTAHASVNAAWGLVLVPLTGLVLLVNFQTIGFFLPYLLEILLAVDTPLSRWSSWAQSPTWMGISLLLTWLTLDLAVKSAMTLHSFRDRARTSGVDLLAAVRRLGKSAAVMALAVVCLSACPAHGAPPAQQGKQAADLDEALDEVFQQRKYSWRKQRDVSPNRTFLDDVHDWLEKQKEAFGKWWDKVFGNEQEGEEDDETSYSQDGDTGQNRAPKGLTGVVQLVTGILLVVAIGAVAWVVVKRMRDNPPETVASASQTTAGDEPDVSDETVTADQLPEDEWLAMARRLEEEGKPRLALRALFLSDLAHLAHRDLLILVKHKSNRDYLYELARRARHEPTRPAAMERNIRLFERCWYGRHETSNDVLAAFRENQREVRTA